MSTPKPARDQRRFAHFSVVLCVVVAMLTIGMLGSRLSYAASPNTGTIIGPGGLCLDVTAPAANDAKVVVDTCSGGSSQQWTMNSNGTISTGALCLVDKGGSTSPKTHARVESCSDSTYQGWQVSGASIVSTASGLCLEDSDGKTTSGSPISLNTCQADAAQTWAVPGSGSGASSCRAAPSVPSNLTGTATASTPGVTLSWGAAPPAANCTLSAYDVFRGGTEIGSSTAPSYTDSHVTAGSTYEYSVDAIDTSGHSSAQSPSVSVNVPSTGAGTSAVMVTDGSELASALAAATPGQTIKLADGTYSGNFVTTASGTASSPIILTGSRQAILASSKIGSGYVLHLTGSDHWQLTGFSVTGAQKGIVLDKSSYDTINGVQVYGVGDEGIHLREGSSYDLVENCYVHNTGLGTAKYGEGIYVGSAVKNWPAFETATDQYGNKVDASDNDSLLDNTVTNTGAEDIDTKEGTLNGTISGNALSDPGQGAAAIDVKGNHYTVSSNVISGATTDHGAIEIWELVAGYGEDSTITANKLGSTGSAVGVYVSKGATGDTVSCSNTVIQPSAGLSNVACTS
jgi:hypothetical protein